MGTDSSPQYCVCVLVLGLGVNFAPHLPSLLWCMSAKKIYKNIKWNSNVAGTPTRDETKMAFVCACVCKTQREKRLCVRGWGLQCAVRVCVLWGEAVNYLQSQAPETATTVLGRASASGKQPSSLFFFTFHTFVSCLLPSTLTTLSLNWCWEYYKT